jgi:hypothetical protein
MGAQIHYDASRLFATCETSILPNAHNGTPPAEDDAISIHGLPSAAVILTGVVSVCR